MTIRATETIARINDALSVCVDQITGDALRDARDLIAEMVEQPGKGEAVAWITEDFARVIPAKTMEIAVRGGGAMLSSMRPYSVPLYTAAPAPTVPDKWKLAMRQLVYYARTSGGTAGPDQILMEACEACEKLLAAAPDAPNG